MIDVLWRRAGLLVAFGLTHASVAIAQAEATNGTIAYKSRAGTFNAALKYGWMVSGPDSVDPARTLRRLIFSAKDIGPAIQACATIGCADGQVTEGMTVDFDSREGPPRPTDAPPAVAASGASVGVVSSRSRLNYWVALNGQKVQYSGTVVTEAFVATANDAQHLAGKLAIDDVAAGGPKVDVQFDVKRSKEFKK